MNKWEKAVARSQLDDEKAVLKALETHYKNALKDIEINIQILSANADLMQSKMYQLSYQKALRDQVGGILQQLQTNSFTTIAQYLETCYQNGFIGTMYSIASQGIPLIAPLNQDAIVRATMTNSKLSDKLYETLGHDMKELKKNVTGEITRGIASGSSWQEIGRNIGYTSGIPMRRAETIARTEGHRVQEEASADARNAAKERGCDVVKQWDSTLDGNTRETHQALDGQIRETDEPFEVDGKKADYPGGFGDPAEDCNCRCVALTRARWGLDEDELKTMQERAEFFGLDKKDSFEDYKEKYLKASGSGTESIDTIKEKIENARNESVRAKIQYDKGEYSEAITKRYNEQYADIDENAISARKQSLEVRNEEIKKQIDKYYDRPGRKDPERAAWDEWKKTFSIEDAENEYYQNTNEIISIGRTTKEIDAIKEQLKKIEAGEIKSEKELLDIVKKNDAEIIKLQKRANDLQHEADEAARLASREYAKTKKYNDLIQNGADVVNVGGIDCVVQEKLYDFPDGTSNGIKKTKTARIYTTPDGTEFVYPKSYNKKVQALSPDDAISTWYKVPENIRSKAQQTVNVVDYYNTQDAYWRKTYKNFTHSYATGGDDITIYRHAWHDLDYLEVTYCHEAAHYIDYTLPGTDKSNRFCYSPEWTKAMEDDKKTSGKASFRAYGENDVKEDFADSVAYYTTQKDEFVKLFPERSKILESILK